jgi:outer membrane protein TolC
VKHRFQILILIFVLLIIQFPACAQQIKEFDLLKDNIESMLPPLETLIDTAIERNPYVKFRDLQIIVNEHKLTGSRLDWTRDIGFQTDVRYGTFDNFASNVVEGQNPALASTRNTQTNYGIGGYIRIPFYDFLGRRNQIKQSKAEVEQAQNYSLVQRSELRQIVIKQYNEVIIKQRLLKIKAKYTETARINMEMAEKQFLNGVVSTAEYSTITEIIARSEADFETTKMDFKTSFMILEEIVGMKFNLTSKLNK